MKNLKKKGFTIVELVIVIAVIAILSAVLIPTFSSLIRKANISSDTVLGRNLNTALNVYEVENGVDSFDEVLEAIKENGYIIANLNAKADGCFFVWESKSNQILLVDSKNNYEVLFNIKEYEPIGTTWHFAISNKDVAAKVALEQPSVTIMQTVANVSDLKELLNANNDKPIYLDESIVLDNENLIEVTQNNNVTLNLGNSLLNTNGIISNVYPIYNNGGTLTLNGGVIGAAGSYIDADGKLVNSPICTENGTTYINNTVFNVGKDGFALFAGDTYVNGAVFNSENIGIYNNGNAQVVVDNSTVISKGRCVWSCNLIYTNEETKEVGHEGTTKITLNSGYFEGGDSKYAPIVSCGGDIEINGGSYVSNIGSIIQFTDSSNGTITITGGTFNGVNFDDITDWSIYCKENYTIEGTGTSTVIIKRK